MSDLSLEGLKPAAAKKIKPFLDAILGSYYEKIHSIHVTGTAITDDFDEKISDVNSVFVLKQMDLKFLELLAPLGKKYGKQKVAAPLIMTPDYIHTSLDVFPIFLIVSISEYSIFCLPRTASAFRFLLPITPPNPLEPDAFSEARTVAKATMFSPAEPVDSTLASFPYSCLSIASVW